MLFPFTLQDFDDRIFGVGVDDVYFDIVGLLKAMRTVDGLDKLFELIANAKKDVGVTVALKIAAAAGDLRFGCQDTNRSVGKVQDAPLSQFNLL